MNANILYKSRTVWSQQQHPKVPSYTGTYISNNFISTRISSWQAHLMGIISHLKHGEGIWWKRNRMVLDSLTMITILLSTQKVHAYSIFTAQCCQISVDRHHKTGISFFSKPYHFLLLTSVSITLMETLKKTTSLPPHPSVGLQHNAGLLPHP